MNASRGGLCTIDFSEQPPRRKFFYGIFPSKLIKVYRHCAPRLINYPSVGNKSRQTRIILYTARSTSKKQTIGTLGSTNRRRVPRQNSFSAKIYNIRFPGRSVFRLWPCWFWKQVIYERGSSSNLQTCISFYSDFSLRTG